MAPETVRAIVRRAVARVTPAPDQIEIVIDAIQLVAVLGIERKNESASNRSIVLTVPAQLHYCGQGKRVVIGDPSQRSPDASLIQVLQEAFSVRDKMLSDTTETLNELTSSVTKSKGRLTALMRLTYLAPSIIEDILGGHQPPELSPKRLLRTSRYLPLDWTDQRKFLGIA
jgi:site-specific DNA recombinase